MLLCAVKIVKDEARRIRATLESIKPFIDRWAILDTGLRRAGERVALCGKGRSPRMAVVKLTGAPDRKFFSLIFPKAPAKAGETGTDLPPGRWRVVLRGADARGRQFRVERTEFIDDGAVRHRAGTDTIDFARLSRQRAIKVARAPDGKSFSLIFPNGPSEAGSTKTDLPSGRYRLQLRGANARGQPFTTERTETIRNGIVRHRAGVDTIDFAVLVTG